MKIQMMILTAALGVLPTFSQTNEHQPAKRRDLPEHREGDRSGRIGGRREFTPEEKETADNAPITLIKRDKSEVAKADFFAEEVER